MSQSHLSENTGEMAWVRELCPDCGQYWETYAKHGLWKSHTIMAHCVHSDEREQRAMAEAEVLAVHCADSNVSLCSGDGAGAGDAGAGRLGGPGQRRGRRGDPGDETMPSTASIRASKIKSMETGAAFPSPCPRGTTWAPPPRTATSAPAPALPQATGSTPLWWMRAASRSRCGAEPFGAAGAGPVPDGLRDIRAVYSDGRKVLRLIYAALD